MNKANKKKIKNLIASWYEEKRSAYLYRKLAKVSKNEQKVLFTQLSKEAENQAILWEQKIKQMGGTTPEKIKFDLRTHFVSWLISLFSLEKLRIILAAMKIRGMSTFLPALVEDHPIPKFVSEVGQSHHLNQANNLRAAIFGINDGLVSNSSLVLGIIGANTDPQIVVITGVAGLLAGAFSMAAGEYVSVRSQRELYEYQIGLERKEVENYPEAEAQELALIYQARGLKKEQAEALANTLIKKPDEAMEVLTRDELGLNPSELVSPYSAAFFSFLSFMIGALLPIVPYLIYNKVHHLYAVILITGCSLFMIGALVSLFTGKNALKGAFRMLIIGLCACAITYYIGHSLGVLLL